MTTKSKAHLSKRGFHIQDIHTQLINLKRSTTRLAHAKAALDAAGISFARLEAIDGQELSESQLSAYSARAARRYFGRSLTKGEIGCYLSHRKALENFVESGCTLGLILEDDIGLAREASEIIALLAEEAPNWTSVVHLGMVTCAGQITEKAVAPLKGIYQLCHAPLFPTFATANIWTKDEAQAFLKSDTVIRAPVDHIFQNWVTTRGGGYTVSPPLFWQTRLDSDIGDRNASRRSAKGRICYQWAKVWRDLRLRRRAKANSRSKQPSADEIRGPR